MNDDKSRISNLEHQVNYWQSLYEMEISRTAIISTRPEVPLGRIEAINQLEKRLDNYKQHLHGYSVMAAAIKDLQTLVTRDHETKESFINRVKSVLEFDPDLKEAAAHRYISFEMIERIEETLGGLNFKRQNILEDAKSDPLVMKANSLLKALHELRNSY